MNLTMADFQKLVNEFAFNKYVQVLSIVIVFFVLAKIVDFILTRLIAKLFKKTKIAFDDQLLEIFHRPIFVSIFLFGLSVALERLQVPPTADYVTAACLKTISVFIWAKAGYKFLSLIIQIVSQDQSRFTLIEERTQPLFVNFSMLLVSGIALYFIFLAWSIDVTAWMASAGIVGLAISFAAKDTLANLFSGVFIMVDAPYKLNDMIVLDSGERGMVTHIGIRSTRILTRDDVEITIPNSMMGSAKIINEAGGPSPRYRIRIAVGVAYGSDIDKVHAVLMEIAENHPDVLKNPKPRVRFRRFGDSSLDHELLCWVNEPVLRGNVQHLLNTEIYKRFIKEKIEIPFPQRDVHIKTNAT